MFDHRLPAPSSKTPAILATVLFVLLTVASYGGYRYWRAQPAPNQRILGTSSGMTAPRNTSNVPSVSPAALRDAPIARLAILVFKSEKRIEVWGFRAERWSRLRDYPVLAASGAAGPKLREGDRQVPEGIYAVADMNPRSKFHMSIKLDYPNAFDQKMADAEGRTKLGGEICLHGKSVSAGCVAIGDPAIEDLYALVERTGPLNTQIIIAPNDMRTHIPVKNPYLKVPWLGELYSTIARELKPFN